MQTRLCRTRTESLAALSPAPGQDAAEIAQILRLTKRTVDFHIDNARIKLGATTRTRAAIKATAGPPDRAIGTSEVGAAVALGTALGDEIATGTTGFIRVGHIRLLANQHDKPSPHTLPIPR